MWKSLFFALLCSNVGALAVAGTVEWDTSSFSPIPLLENANTTGLFPMDKCGSFALEEATIDDMQAAMGDGTLTSTQLVVCYMQRVYQTAEYTNSLLQLNPDVLVIASQLDNERANGKVRGPLHGIPFTVKDNIASKDKLETTAGSWALLGSIVPRDAYVVAQLRRAGAVLFGKAALSEWADMRSNNYSEGYSARGGQCRSAYNLSVNPGGSSSGSGVGVSTNAIAFSVGTETDGSVISPAQRNAIVGIKPTVGLTSRAGVVPESEHQDTVGTFGRTVRDATYALDAIYGIDTDDNYTVAQTGRTPSGGFAQFLVGRDALEGAVFGVPWNSFWTFANKEQQTILASILDLMKSAGATIINNTEIPGYETLVAQDGWDWDWGTTRGYPNESEYTYIKVDFYNNIKTYLSKVINTNIKSLEDLVQYNYDNDGTEGGHPWPLGIPAFYSGQDGFLASLATKGVKDKTYWQALHFCQGKTQMGIDAALTYRGEKLGGLLVPADVAQTYQIAAQAGYPVITIPAGVHSGTGMPFGLAIMQSAWKEAELVKWASAVEDLQKSSRTPYKRTMPKWYGHLEKIIPVKNDS